MGRGRAAPAVRVPRVRPRALGPLCYRHRPRQAGRRGRVRRRANSAGGSCRTAARGRCARYHRASPGVGRGRERLLALAGSHHRGRLSRGPLCRCGGWRSPRSPARGRGRSAGPGRISPVPGKPPGANGPGAGGGGHVPRAEPGRWWFDSGLLRASAGVTVRPWHRAGRRGRGAGVGPRRQGVGEEPGRLWSGFLQRPGRHIALGCLPGRPGRWASTSWRTWRRATPVSPSLPPGTTPAGQLDLSGSRRAGAAWSCGERAVPRSARLV